VKQNDVFFHVRGESLFTDDLEIFPGLLHTAVLPSSVAHGRILKLETLKAQSAPGVAAVFTAADITGENQIGGIIPDEPLLAEQDVHYVGQPIAFVVAETRNCLPFSIRARLPLKNC
jgi:xanthine dehydrogenase large subunit